MDSLRVDNRNTRILTGIINVVCVIVTSLCISRVNLMGISPFAVAFFIGVYLTSSKINIVRNVFFSYVSSVVGLYSTSSLAVVIRYGVLMLGLITILCILEKSFRKNVYIFAVISGIFVIAMNVTVHYFYPDSISVIVSIIEGVLIFSAICIFYHGIEIIRDDYVKIATENEAAISVMLLVAILFLGMPVSIGKFVVAETFGLFSILFVYYKFGFGLGTSWTVAAGIIISLILNYDDYVMVWAVIAICSYALSTVFANRRLVYAFLFLAIYYGVGVLKYDFLISENGTKAVFTAVFLFLLLPREVMLFVDGRVASGEIEEFSSEWGQLVLRKIEAFAMAIKRIEYTFAGEGNYGLGFRDVGNIIEDFTSKLDKAVPIRKTIEAKVVEELARKDIQVKNITLTRDSSGICEVYITVRNRKRQIVSSEVVRKIIENNIGKKLRLSSESRAIVGCKYDTLCFDERAIFECKTAVRKLSKYENQVSGDNYYVGNISDSQMLIILADGMGNGERAAIDSETIIDVTEELLGAGFDKETSIKLVNLYLANKNRGERFTTLDMLILDLNSGYGYMYKQGAATTFIKRNDWMEMVKSTSLPVGIVEDAEYERCLKKFYNGNVIVMVSDGVLESVVFENKEEFMRELIMDCEDMTPEEMVIYITEQVKNISGNRLRDDATIIVCQLVKTL